MNFISVDVSGSGLGFRRLVMILSDLRRVIGSRWPKKIPESQGSITGICDEWRANSSGAIRDQARPPPVLAAVGIRSEPLAKFIRQIASATAVSSPVVSARANAKFSAFCRLLVAGSFAY